MGENQQRRQAQRQKRGLLRVEQILHAAGVLFAEVRLRQRNDQFDCCPCRHFTSLTLSVLSWQRSDCISICHRHHGVYDAFLSPDMIALPFQPFLDSFIDRVVAFNQNHLGYLALELASTISFPLALILADLQRR